MSMTAISVLAIPAGKDWQTPRFYRGIHTSADVLNPDNTLRMDCGETFNEAEHPGWDYCLGMNAGPPAFNRDRLDQFIAAQRKELSIKRIEGRQGEPLEFVEFQVPSGTRFIAQKSGAWWHTYRAGRGSDSALTHLDAHRAKADAVAQAEAAAKACP